MLQNLVPKLSIIWFIWIVSCSWSNHTILLLMFVAEKVLLHLVISLTDKQPHQITWNVSAHRHQREQYHDDVIKWKHFPRYWPSVVQGIHRSPVDSPHKGQCRGVLMFSLICTRTNGWVNNRDAGGLRRHRPHYDVIVMDSHRSTTTGTSRVGHLLTRTIMNKQWSLHETNPCKRKEPQTHSFFYTYRSLFNNFRKWVVYAVFSNIPAFL